MHYFRTTHAPYTDGDEAMYQGSEAYRLDASQEEVAYQHAAPAFEVIPGRGLDAQVRRGVSEQFISRLIKISACAVIIFAIAFVRMGFFSMAISAGSQTTNLRSQIKEAKSTQDNLTIEQSVLANESRIGRIATQTYGMEAAGNPEQMSAGSTTEPQTESDAPATQKKMDSTAAEKKTDTSSASKKSTSSSDIKKTTNTPTAKKSATSAKSLA